MTLDGATRSFRMPKEGTSLLDAALEANIDAPYACKAGRLLDLPRQGAGGREPRWPSTMRSRTTRCAQGYVLTCQCFPLSDKVVVSYDQ